MSYSAGQDPPLFTTSIRWDAFSVHLSSYILLFAPLLILISFLTSPCTHNHFVRICNILVCETCVNPSSRSRHSWTKHTEFGSSSIDVTIPIPVASNQLSCQKTKLSGQEPGMHALQPCCQRATELEKCLGHLSARLAISPKKEES